MENKEHPITFSKTKYKKVMDMQVFLVLPGYFAVRAP
jgi:hypothetical protein